MKQKKWKDCPTCGALGSMQFKTHRKKIFESKKMPDLKVGPLSEYVCSKCHDGIYTISSSNLIEAKLAEHQAHHEAQSTMLAEVLPVSEACHILNMTRQGVIQLMKRGKLSYVFFGKMRVPKREAVLQYQAA